MPADIGVVRFTVHQAKDLDNSVVRGSDLNAYAKVFLGRSTTSIHTTSRAKLTSQPVWESSTEFLCANRSSSVITVKVIDDREFAKDPTVGYLSVRLQDLLEARKETGRDWWTLSGCKSGRLRLGAEWKPLNMAGSLYGADQYTPPIGVVRLLLKEATDVKNVEATLGGKVRGNVSRIRCSFADTTFVTLHPERPIRPCIGQQYRSGSYRGSEQQYV
jgi:Ca2+-dependent lipid-binding protein